MPLGNTRFWYIDALKVGAIVGVVAIHVFSPLALSAPNGTAWWLANVVYSASRWSVPIFVMASGALVLGRERRRLGRVLPAAIIWTVVYLAYSAWREGGTTDPAAIAALIVSGRPYGHLYFLAVILGLYVVAPFVRPTFAFGIVALTIAAADAALRLVGLGGATENVFTWWLPFLGYFVLGYAIHVAPIRRPRLLAVIAALAITVQIAALAWSTSYAPFLRPYLENYLALPVVVASVALFAFARSVAEREVPGQAVLARLSGLTFGVYLAHVLILKELERLPLTAPLSVVLIAIWLATLALAFGFAALLWRTPFATAVGSSAVRPRK